MYILADNAAGFHDVSSNIDPGGELDSCALPDGGLAQIAQAAK